MAIYHSVKVGDKFAMWTVIGESYIHKDKNWGRMCLCRCDCGNEKPVKAWDLVRDRTKGCGCTRKGGRKNQFKVGDVIGYWTVIEPAPRYVKLPEGHVQMLTLRCVCGMVAERKAYQFSKRQSKTNPRADKPSCGCMAAHCPVTLVTAEDVERSKTHRRLRCIWHGMLRRCDPSRSKEPRYRPWSGKGIRVCQEWNEFEAFKAWALENNYQNGLSIDRVDSNGNYCPDNCEWVTSEENTRRAAAEKTKRYETLKSENVQLKQRVQELEMRVAALEGHEAMRHGCEQKESTAESGPDFR